jgi:hypothetical protein
MAKTQPMGQIKAPQAMGQVKPVDLILPEKYFDFHIRAKAMNVLKVSPAGVQEKIFTLSEIYLPKIINTPDNKVFVIGGAKDLKITKTLSHTKMLTKGMNNLWNMTDVAEMKCPRASFGCCLSKDSKKIYVVGGYLSDVQVTKRTEVYDIDANTWTELPPLNSETCSSGVAEFTTGGKNYLYSFAGLWREPEVEVSLLKTIERIDLSNLQAGWQKLQVTMPIQMCDVGAMQISATHMLIYGGWSVRGIEKVYVFDGQTFNEHSSLEKSDFFLTNGVVDKSGSKLTFAGHHQLHTFDMTTKKFAVIQQRP